MELGSPSANFSDRSPSSMADLDRAELASESRSRTIGEAPTSFGQAETLPALKEISVVFSDICSYTALTDILEGTEVAGLLDEYFESIGEVVFKYKQSLDKQIESACIGNSAIAVFGSPLPLENHAWMAVQMASEMRQCISEFNARRVKAQQPQIQVSIGIHSDLTFSSRIGASKYMEFTAIGDGIYLGYRLEGLSKQYCRDTILSENTYQMCADRIWVRELDFIRLQGKNTPMTIYEFLGLRTSPLSEDQQQVIEHYEKGRQLYRNRKFALALGEFATVLEIDTNDKPSAMYLARCQRMLKDPPQPDWDGTWLLKDS